MQREAVEPLPEAGSARPDAPSLVVILRSALAGVVMGVLVLVFVISFGAIIYSGPMAHELSRGLGMTLAGAAIMAIVGAFTVSYRGTIVQPQDVTTIILSLGVVSVAAGWSGSGDALFATVATLVATAAALTGAVAWIAGRVRLGFALRFMPYPVLGGFLAATAFLILLGALGMAMGRSVDLWTLSALLDPGAPQRWLPWLAYAILLVVIVRRFRHWLVLPGCVLLGVLGFYLALALGGGSLETARAAGLLLGPFEGESLAQGIGPWVFREADWGAVLGQAPTMLTVAGMAIVGTLLNASALGLAIDREIDANRDLRGIGLANLGGALGGGLPGYHLLTPTIFARNLGLESQVCGIAIAGFAVGALFFGAGFLSVLPVGVFAGILLFIAVDMLYSWLWEERRKLPARDYAVVLLILAVAATVGFLQAIGVGLVAASLLFIVAYARVDVVRLRSSAAALRSRVERPDHELRRLAETGGCALVYQLSGYLFFGTASRLIEELRERLASEPPRFILLDFRRVSGMDASATFALGKLARSCATQGVELVLTGLSDRLRADVVRAAPPDEAPTLVARLDDALRSVEERLLAHAPAEEADAGGFLEDLRRLHPDFDPAAHFRTLDLPPGTEVFAQGSPADDMVLLVTGRLRAEIVGHDAVAMPVAAIRAGTLVGEIGLYAGVPRTARVVAEEACRVLVVSTGALKALAATDPALAASFHWLAASHLARRLSRTNALLRDAEAG